MEAQDKIKKIRRTKRLSREDLYLRLKEIFGEQAIKPNTIWRIESGITSARLSSLHQICVGLGVSLKDILKDLEPKSKLVDLVEKDARLEQFTYNRLATAEILTPANFNFLIQELILSPGGATETEEDPIELGKFQKWVYGLSGQVTCIVGREKHILNKGDCLSFESNLPHSFENKSSRKSRCLVLQNPRHI